MLSLEERYIRGETTVALAESLGVSRQTVCNKLKRRGVKLRSKKQAANRAYSLKNNYNDDCFKELDKHTEYWLGFLMADGNVLKNRITVRVHKKDFIHVESFSNFCGVIRKPTIRGNECHIAFSSSQMVNDLKKWGVVENKSLVCEAHPELCISSNFWRGVIDGDGSLGVYKQNDKYYPRLTLACGSKILIEQFRNYAQNLLSKNINMSSRGDNYYSVAFKSRPAYRLIKEIYGEPNPCLLRKQKIAAEITAMEVYHS